jgi:hypothetical protein
MAERDTIIQGLDLLDIVSYISRKNKKFQAILLTDLEEVLGKDSEEYQKVRKIVLDNLNNYTRSIVRTIFGDIEFMVK